MIGSCIVSVILAVSMRALMKDPFALLAGLAVPIVLFLVWEIIQEKRFNRMENKFYRNLRKNQQVQTPPREPLIKTRRQGQETPVVSGEEDPVPGGQQKGADAPS